MITILRKPVSRRRFLRGLGGATLGLPLLEAIDVRAAGAPAKPGYCAFMVSSAGVQQTSGSEPDTFWPTKLGALTKASLAADSGRAVSVLADRADELLVVRGISVSNGLHAEGACESLTGYHGDGVRDPPYARSLGESIDNRIAREYKMEPLALYAGNRNWRGDRISFRGPRDLRVGENRPSIAYNKMIGMIGTGGSVSPALAAELGNRRKSVNDLLRAELTELLARTDLSADDRRRLDMHFSSVRDVEIKITNNTLSDADIAAAKKVEGDPAGDANRLTIETLHMDIIGLAFASGYTYAATLQAGDPIDTVRYTIDGRLLISYHALSHRASTEDGYNDGTQPDAVQLHHKIDMMRLRQFKYLADTMASHTTPEGSLLDLGYALWTNGSATGLHSSSDIPELVLGKARGFLKTGQYIQASTSGQVRNNKMMNTLLNAAGIRKADGSFIDDFGDPMLPKGVIGAMIA